MSTLTAKPIQDYTSKDYKSDLKPIWCPGCGDFGVVQAIYRALANVGRAPHEILVAAGEGVERAGVDDGQHGASR